MLLCANPALVMNKGVMNFPCTMIKLLRRINTKSLSHFCKVAPKECRTVYLPGIFPYVNEDHLIEILPPLINCVELHAAMVSVLQLGLETNVDIILNLSPENINIMLEAPMCSIAVIAGALDIHRVRSVIVPLLQEPPRILRDVVVPLVFQTKDATRLASMANHIPVQVLLWLLRAADADRLADFVNACEASDLDGDGYVTKFMQQTSDDEELVKTKMAPTMMSAEPNHLLDMLRSMETLNVIRLLRHLNVDVLVRLINSTQGSDFQKMSVVFAANTVGDAVAIVEQMVDQMTEVIGLWRNGTQK